jgi:hypothetical protein
VLWTLTPAGAKAPLDTLPSREGNTLVLQPSALGGKYLSVVLTGDTLTLARGSGALWVNHWATCPDREEWRAKQAEKKAGGGDGG